MSSRLPFCSIRLYPRPMTQSLLETLPPPWRLALAYAPRAQRDRWLTLLALDTRLAGVVSSAREPIMAQMRLAWWRDRLRDPAEKWPKGEPLLAALACWGGEHGALIGLVDGWEALLGDAPLGAEALLQLVEGRAAACQTLAPAAPQVGRLARGWALADLLAHLSHPQEREAVSAAMAEHDWRGQRLPRACRPLAVLHGIAARSQGDPAKMQGISLVTLMRLGLIGI